MEDKALEWIERYFRDALPAEERAAFEQMRSSDPVFRREVAEYEKTIRLIRLQGRQALKGRLAERGRQLDAEKAQAVFRPQWWMGLLALALLALAWWFFEGKKEASPNTLPGAEIQRNNTETPVLPTPSPIEQAKPEPSAGGRPSSSPPAAESPSFEEQLFTAHFRPYRDESLEPAVRGDGERTPEEQFRQLYWDGRYQDAMAAFEALENGSKSNGNLQFLRANCLLATGRAKAAVQVLENVLQTGRSRFLPEAKWLLALAYLKDGEQGKAKTLLREMAGDASSPRRGEAGELLERIGE